MPTLNRRAVIFLFIAVSGFLCLLYHFRNDYIYVLFVSTLVLFIGAILVVIYELMKGSKNM